MHKVAVLIDFTEGCKIALHQARVVAQKVGTGLSVINFIGNTSEEEVKEEVRKFTASVLGDSIPFEPVAAHGDVLHNTTFVLSHIDPVLVVVGTHGIRGIKQQLFGAHILKLVQSIAYPCLVVQENTVVNESGLNAILFPVGPHPQFHIKIEQTAALAKIFGSMVVEYEIERSMLEPNPAVVANRKAARDYFEEHGINFQQVMEDTTIVSLGYARQTIKYAADHHFNAISVMSDVPADDVYLGRTDKENLLTNPAGIPVLCCNR